MGLDIRVPLGMIFTATGLMLTVYGGMTLHSDIYVRSGGININLIWGAVMLLFGVIMWVAGKRKPSGKL
jgi:multisubunit Na+/H+ antiporter MnhG subunit